MNRHVGGDERDAGVGERAEQLHAEVGAAEDADGDGAPDAGRAVRRDGADRVVDLEAVEQQDRVGDDHAADGAGEDRPDAVDHVGARP
jgi:hypothetical protein